MKRNLLTLCLILGLFAGQPLWACSCISNLANSHPIKKLINSNSANFNANACKITITKSISLSSFGFSSGRFVVPGCLKNITINGGVTVTGNFYSTAGGGTLTIEGKNKNTSKIRGTQWNNSNYARGPIKGEEADKRAAIFSKSRVLVVRKLKSIYPNKFHILGRKKVTCTDLVLQAKPGDTDGDMGLNFATTDGIGGAPGSVIKRCDIDTYDDAIKIYGENMVVENVKIFWNRNGAPLQMGWGASNFYQKGNATITGLTVIKRGNNHNQGIISWAKGEFSSNKKGTRTLTFNGNNNIPNDNKVIQFGASGKTNNVILNLKGSYVCNNKSKFQKVFFKNTGGNCLARSQGCSGNFNKTGRFAQPEANLSLSVYPNPASNAIIIAGIPEEQRVYIYNLQGKAVLPDQKGPKVNIATLPPGMYLVRTADGLQQAKFLKQ